MKASMEGKRRGSVFSTVRKQIAGAGRGRTPDYRLSFESARTLFAALPSDGAVLVRWESIAELDARGFNLYRDGAATPLNPTLIPAFWGPSGGIYEWGDASGAPDPTTYYWLEVVTASGRVERIGPVPFYGGNPPVEEAKNVKCPLLIQFAEKDDRSNAAWPAYEEALKAAKVRYEAFVYPGTQHGFNNDTTPR